MADGSSYVHIAVECSLRTPSRPNSGPWGTSSEKKRAASFTFANSRALRGSPTLAFAQPGDGHWEKGACQGDAVLDFPGRDLSWG